MVHFPRELPTTALDLYLCEISAISLLSREEEDVLVEQARHGSVEAKQALIEDCLRYVAKVASTWYRTMPSGRDEYQDLIAIGNLALVEKIDIALKAARPAAYLRAVVKEKIWSHCAYRSWLIPVPENRSYLGKSPGIASLNAPLGSSEMTYEDLLAAHSGAMAELDEDSLLASLKEAIEKVLTPTEREVVKRYYSLEGSGAHTTREISYALTGNPKSNFAGAILQRAYKKLRRQLERVS